VEGKKKFLGDTSLTLWGGVAHRKGKYSWGVYQKSLYQGVQCLCFEKKGQGGREIKKTEKVMARKFYRSEAAKKTYSLVYSMRWGGFWGGGGWLLKKTFTKDLGGAEGKSPLRPTSIRDDRAKHQKEKGKDQKPSESTLWILTIR